MTATLKQRKQQAVREAIFDAAIELFTAKGFDQTTVEEVAQAAGVSRRSFFRYYASKDDLLAQSVVNYGLVLSAAIAECPTGMAPVEMMRETIAAGLRHAGAQPHLRNIMQMAAHSPAARQAHQSRMREVEDTIAEAYAKRLRKASRDEVRPRLMAGMTLSIMSTAMIAWFTGEHRELSAAAKHVFTDLQRFFN